MKRKFDSLEDELDIEPVQIELEEVSIESTNTKDDLENDYKMLRHKIATILSRGERLVDEAVKAVVVSAGAAKQVEAAARALDSLTNASKELLEVHDKILKIESKLDKDIPEEELKGNDKVNTNLMEIIKQKKAAQ